MIKRIEKKTLTAYGFKDISVNNGKFTDCVVLSASVDNDILVSKSQAKALVKVLNSFIKG